MDSPVTTGWESIVFFLCRFQHCDSGGQQCQILLSLSPSSYLTARGRYCSDPSILILSPTLWRSPFLLIISEEQRELVQIILHGLIVRDSVEED